jgi:peroxiredoxin Q/BCP
LVPTQHLTEKARVSIVANGKSFRRLCEIATSAVCGRSCALAIYWYSGRDRPFRPFADHLTSTDDCCDPKIQAGQPKLAFFLYLADFDAINIHTGHILLHISSDTSGCTAEAKDFNALLMEFAEANAAVVGVSPDPVKSHDKFRDKYELAFPLLSDEAKSMLEAYGVWVEKSMYGRKYMGVERTTFLIDAEGRIATVWRKVKTTGHAAAVLAAVKAI